MVEDSAVSHILGFLNSAYSPTEMYLFLLLKDLVMLIPKVGDTRGSRARLNGVESYILNPLRSGAIIRTEHRVGLTDVYLVDFQSNPRNMFSGQKFFFGSHLGDGHKRQHDSDLHFLVNVAPVALFLNCGYLAHFCA